MIVCWFDQQLASIELARMKYSGSDFKFTSQANHMAKLLVLKKDYERTGFHLQRLYKRRKSDENGVFKSTFSSIMSTSVREGNVGARPNLNTPSDGGRSGVKEQWEEMEELASDVGFTRDERTSNEGYWSNMPAIKPCNKKMSYYEDSDDNSWKDM